MTDFNKDHKIESNRSKTTNLIMTITGTNLKYTLFNLSDQTQRQLG